MKVNLWRNLVFIGGLLNYITWSNTMELLNVKIPKYLINVITAYSTIHYESFSGHKMKILLLQSSILNCQAGTDVHCYWALEVLVWNKGHVGMEPSMCHHVLASQTIAFLTLCSFHKFDEYIFSFIWPVCNQPNVPLVIIYCCHILPGLTGSGIQCFFTCLLWFLFWFIIIINVSHWCTCSKCVQRYSQGVTFSCWCYPTYFFIKRTILC